MHLSLCQSDDNQKTSKGGLCLEEKIMVGIMQPFNKCDKALCNYCNKRLA